MIVQLLSCVRLFSTPWTTAHQSLLSFTISRVCSDSCPLSQWCYLTISSSAGLFSFCLQFFPASGSFPMSQLFASGGQSIGVSAIAAVLPKYSQDWFSLGWTDLISLQSKGLSRVFSSTTMQRHQFFGAQSSFFMLQFSHPYMTTGKNIALTRQTFVGKVMSLLLICFLGRSWLLF